MPTSTELLTRSTRTPARRTTFLAELDDAPALGSFGPNWFASVMGTGIVAIVLVTLPFDLPGAAGVATGFWLLASALLVVVTTATALHHVHHPVAARGHLADPVMSHFYGAPAMALMTVGTGALLVGEPLLGARGAIGVDVVLWSAGTVLGLGTAVVVPYRMFTAHRVGPDAAFGGWLMPVVPPMVSAAGGALLVAHAPAGQARETLLLACYAFFGISLLAGLVVIALIWSRLAHHGMGAAAGVPTLWIVLGVLGQSVTAVHHLAEVAPHVLPASYADGFVALTLVYGVPVWGFAMLWLAVVAALTLRTAREGLPFSLTWWSFTFPVGTLVTGTSGLAVVTGLVVLQVAAGLLLVGLLVAWAVVAGRTARGVWSGRLLLPPAPAAA